MGHDVWTDIFEEKKFIRRLGGTPRDINDSPSCIHRGVGEIVELRDLSPTSEHTSELRIGGRGISGDSAAISHEIENSGSG